MAKSCFLMFWLLGGNMSESKSMANAENERLTKEKRAACARYAQIDSARQSVLASALHWQNELMSLNLLTDGGAIGERGDAVM